MSRAAGTDPLPAAAERAAREAAAQRKADGAGADAGARREAPLPDSAPMLAATVAETFSDTRFFRRTVFVCGMTVATALALALIWKASEVLLVLYAAILIAVLLRAPANWLSRHTRLSQNFALALSVLVFGALFATLIYLLAVPMAEQAAQLADTLPKAAAAMRYRLQEHQWARPLLLELSRMRLNLEALMKARGAISSALAGVGGTLVALFIGVYLAAQPRLYQRGLMHLLPRRMRPRAAEVLDQIGSVLRWWLLGRLIIMTVVGSAAGIGLSLLGIPSAFTLGVITGLLEFVPYLGPILSGVPALLVAFNIGATQAFYVLLLYIAIQSAEGYLLSPLVEQRTVSLPPALVIFATLLLAALAGPLGAVLASPLTAAGIVAVRLLYVEKVVEQPQKQGG